MKKVRIPVWPKRIHKFIISNYLKKHGEANNLENEKRHIQLTTLDNKLQSWATNEDEKHKDIAHESTQ